MGTGHRDCRSCKWIGEVEPVSRVHECQSPRMALVAEAREIDPEYRDTYHCRFWERREA